MLVVGSWWLVVGSWWLGVGNCSVKTWVTAHGIFTGDSRWGLPETSLFA